MKRFLFSILILFLFSMTIYLIYRPGFSGQFYFDSKSNIYQNRYIKINHLDISEFKKVLFGKVTLRERPLSNLSLGLNYYWKGLNPKYFRVINIIIHIATTLAIFFFFYNLLQVDIEYQKRLLKKPLIINPVYASSIIALIWALHPLQSQAITYIVQRMTSQATLFSFLSMGLYLKARGYRSIYSKKRTSLFYLLSLFSFFLAVGSKEIALIVPILIILIELYYFDLLKNLKKSSYLITISILGIIFIILVNHFFNIFDRIFFIFSHFTDKFTGKPFSPYERLLTEFRVLIKYLYLFIFPYYKNLSLHHEIELSKGLFLPPTTFLSLIFILGSIIFSIYWRKKWRLLSFLILAYWLSHIEESTIWALDIIYEHRMYLPSAFLVGIGVLLVYRLLQFLRPRFRLFIGILLLTTILVCYGINTYRRNVVWGNTLLFYKEDIKKDPENLIVLNNYGDYLINIGHLNEAERIFHKILDICAKKFVKRKALFLFYANYNLGNLNNFRQNFYLAFKYYLNAYHIDPRHPKVNKRLSALAFVARYKRITNLITDLNRIGFTLNRAYKILEKVYIEGDDYPDTVFNLIVASVYMYDISGDSLYLEKAHRYLSEALIRHKNNPKFKKLIRLVESREKMRKRLPK